LKVNTATHELLINTVKKMVDTSLAAPFREAGMGNHPSFNHHWFFNYPKANCGNHEGSKNNVMPFKASLYIKHITPRLEVKTYFITQPVSYE
jgi:hypothetical protein